MIWWVVTTSDAPDGGKGGGDSYLDRLNEDRAAAQDGLDASLLKLSGGGLGLSFAFVRQFAGENPQRPWMLTGAWLLWVACLVSVTWSHYLSTRVMEEAFRRRLAKVPAEGGILNRVVRGMNLVNTILFTVGAVLITLFMIANLEMNRMPRDTDRSGLAVERGTGTTMVDTGAVEERGRVAPMETTSPPSAPPPQSTADGGGGEANSKE